MATLKKRYTDINDCLKHIRLQVEESINFANRFVPKCKNPIQLFLWLKPHLKYKLDPNNTELLQSFPTLINNNYYGTPGAGDCDCFSIAMLAACSVQKWPGAKIYIKLVGRNKFTPVHIYTGVDIAGKEYNLDLTNKIPLKERNYPYKQKIYFKRLKT